jgi:hypothetical protein
MAIKEKLTDEELALVEILRHPIWASEFIRNLGVGPEEEEKLWEYTLYQKEMLCDFNSYVTLCCGRAIGKSEVILGKVIWHMINTFYEESVVITVPNKVHLDPLFLKITRWLRNNPFLKHFVDRNSINNADMTIKMKNNFVLDCRIAGKSGTGANVIGLHVPFIIIDEAGYYPWGTYIELLPTLNTFQKGFQLFVAGVPDGRREKSVLFNSDQLDKNFSKHRIPAHRNPRYSEADEERNLKQFRGRESEDYVHMVLGEHGSPVYSMFDRELMMIQEYPIFVARYKGKDFEDNPMQLYDIAATIPVLPRYYEEVMFGIDLGYTEPTVISILYKVKDRWYFHARITLYQVDYPIQEKLIDLLDSKFLPVLISVDEGSAGKSVIQNMMVNEDFSGKAFKSRMMPVNFGGTVVIGYDNDSGDEIVLKTKQFGMQRLQAMTNNHEIVFTSEDDEMIGELERTTYSRTEAGEVKYAVESLTGKASRGDDHNTAALVCAVVGYYLKFESPINSNIKLFNRISWL